MVEAGAGASASPDGAGEDTPLLGADAEVIDVLVENHRRFLAFLEARVGSRTEAEELLQSAYARALERGAALRAHESAVAWFFRLLRNAVVDHHRAGARRARLTGDLDPELEPTAPDPETEAVLCACLSALAPTLKPEYALALRRVELEGTSLQVYADEVGITAGNAAVRLHRARQALGQRLRATCRTCAEHGCLDCSCGPSEARG